MPAPDLPLPIAYLHPAHQLPDDVLRMLDKPNPSAAEQRVIGLHLAIVKRRVRDARHRYEQLTDRKVKPQPPAGLIQ